MASIFTYDPTPPRVSSPWLTPSASTSAVNELGDVLISNRSDGSDTPEISILADLGITKLESEPQDGPVEYKLHLLLRPRKSFTALSTGNKISGSAQVVPRATVTEPSKLMRGVQYPSTPPSLITRQNRLQHLTTQLLWRLQQSSPYHASSAANLVIPSLPEATTSPGSVIEGSVLPGLEESEGALYEIGVSDDGTFVGLTDDEMDESLQNLKSMAGSLGCVVRVLRKVIVGDCEWSEKGIGTTLPMKTHVEKLWVAEALVIPSVRRRDTIKGSSSDVHPDTDYDPDAPQDHNEFPAHHTNRTQQLRVSLTGSTTSGKSSLLGTLSTSTLDNGRGKSRLSLLKHRHEIVSGVTSSVAPEIFGYSTRTATQDAAYVVNYSTGNVSSWTDIHNEVNSGRLIVVIDSAGHPRYRRTAVRSLLSWAPHWTLCCIAADDEEENSSRVGATLKSHDILGLAGADVDLSKAHLELCLKLNLPLVIVITKFDIASKNGLRQTLVKILSTIKAYGRRPLMLPAQKSASVDHMELNAISATVHNDIQKKLETSGDDAPFDMVPIAFTSAVTGEGISTVHALLRQLPIPERSMPKSSTALGYQVGHERPKILFHIDEVFQRANATHDPSYVLGGVLKYGNLSLGDELLLGPFAPDSTDDDNAQSDTLCSSSYPEQDPGNMLVMHRGSPSTLDRTTPRKEPALISPWPEDTWRTVRVVSVRNLRRAVRRLESDQVGTIGVMFVRPPIRPLPPRIRRGMVLLPVQKNSAASPNTYTGVTASFDQAQVSGLSINTNVITYIASIRAPARITQAEILSPVYNNGTKPDLDVEDAMWGFDDSGSEEGGVELQGHRQSSNSREIAVTLRFLSCREWIEIGTNVLIMPEGGEKGEKGNLGLEGYKGRIIEGVI